MTDPKIQFALVVEFLRASVNLCDGGAGPLDEDGRCVFCGVVVFWGLGDAYPLRSHLASCMWGVWATKLNAVRSILPRGEFF